jgi:hypothetical protein
MTHQDRFIRRRNNCRSKRSATLLLVTIITGGWEEFAHLVDTHTLYPNLAWSCDGRIEESFPAAANGCKTVNNKKERSLNV